MNGLQEEMRCTERGCGRRIDTSTPVTLQVGCRAVDNAFPCKECGRLHWRSGEPVFNRQGKAAYWDGGTVRLEEIKPDKAVWLFPFSILLDESWFGGLLINMVLALFRSRKRARVIVYEDAIRATGIWTRREAATVVGQMTKGPDENYHYPSTKRGFRRLLQYLGVTD